MKKKKIEKGNRLKGFIVTIMLILCLMSNSMMHGSANNNCDGQKTGEVKSNGENNIDPNSAPVGTESAVGQPYGEVTYGARYTITSAATGNSVTYNVFTSQKWVDRAQNLGLCKDNPCITSEKVGLSGERDSRGEQIATAGKNDAQNGVSYTYDNDVSLFRAKTVLELDGISTEDMSREEIEKKATEIAYANKAFSSSEFELQTEIVKMNGSGAGAYVALCSASQTSTACEIAKNQKFNLGTLKSDMKNETAITDDWGSICSGPDTCPQEPQEEPKRPPEPTEFTIDVSSCSPQFSEIPEVPFKKDPDGGGPYGGECGLVAGSVTYRTFPVACNYALMLETTTVTARLPGVQNTVFAGTGFNWGKVNLSSTNISTTLYDDGPLQREFAVVQDKIAGIKGAIACVQGKIDELTRKYNSEYSSCLSKAAELEREYEDCCDDDCGYYDDECIKNGGTDCYISQSCDCSAESAAVSSQLSQCLALTQAYESAKSGLENTIAGYQADLALAEEEKQKLSDCQASIPAGGSSTTYDTVKIVNEKMVLNNNYTQLYRSIKAVLKNSGKGLTEEEKSSYDNGLYLNLNTDFFVPYNIPKGTTGEVIGDIVGDLSIPDYRCPIEADNYVLCRGNKCEGGLEIIYRPISLTNPFPNIKGDSKYRKMGSNWNDVFAENLIEKNRNVNDYEVYKMTPLYTITLNPSVIKEIRKYNKKHTFNDFEMHCIDGYKCTSSFLWETFTDIIDQGKSCATSNGWNTNCYYGGVIE